MRFGAADLALTVQETGELFGTDLTREQLALLHRRTEGWPVAVQLARLWLSKEARRSEGIAAFSGRTAEVARYLLEQVLQDLEPEIVDFLIETSILDRFDARLADVARGRGDSRAILERLRELDALLVPLDPEREWFRYHNLFADYLRQRLLARGSIAANLLHRRAAGFLAAEGMVLDAVRHAIKGGDVALAIDLVRQAGGWELVIELGPGLTATLLGLFDETVIRASADLLLIQSYLLVKRGDLFAARRMIDQAAMMGSGGRLGRDQLVVDTLHRGYADDLYDREWRTSLGSRIDAMAADDHVGRACLHGIAACADLGLGDFASAEAESRLSIEEMQFAGSTLGEAFATCHLAQSLVHRGRLDEAETLLRTMLATAETLYGQDSGPKALGSCLLGNLLYWRNEQAEARALISASLDSLEAQDGWVDAYAAAYRTAAALDHLNSGADAALQMLDRADRKARDWNLPALRHLVTAWRLETLALAGDMGAADGLVREASLPERLKAGQFGWRPTHALSVALAQWHLHAGRPAAAQAVLREERQACLRQGRRLDGARVDSLAAAAHRERGEADAMIACLGRALAFVGEQRADRVLLDMALPVEPMLQALIPANGAPAAEGAREVAERMLQDLRGSAPTPIDGLSSRELAVLQQLCLGRSNKQISWHLGMSENTVKFHLKRIFAKLGVNSRGGALAAAQQRHLVPRRHAGA